MRTEPGNIKVIVAAGVRAPDAIRAALPGSLADFAERHGFHRPHVSMCIHGRQRLDTIRDALARDLSVSREWLDDLLDAQRKSAQDADSTSRAA